MSEVAKLITLPEEDLIELSFSKSKTLMRCKKKYDYKYNQKLRKKTKSLPLRRGSWIHKCLETLYSHGDWTIGYNQYKKEVWDEMFDEEKIEYINLPQEVERIMTAYIKKYQQIDRQYEILAVEQEFKIQIPGTKIALTGIIDLVAKDTLGIWVIDHKTAKKIPDEEFRLVDTQLSLYYWVVHQLRKYLKIEPNEKIAGVMFNYIRTKVPTEPQLLKKGGLSKRKDIDCDYDTYFKALLKYGLDPSEYEDILSIVSKNQFYTRRALPKSQAMLKKVISDLVDIGTDIMEIERFPRNFTRDCSWDCEYKNLCISELHGHDTQFMIDNEYEYDEGKDKGKEEEDGSN